MKTKQLLFVAAAVTALGLPLVRGGENAKPVEPTKTSAPTPSASVKAAGSESSQQLNVIGYLEKRDRTITIKSGPKGTVYSVATKDGRILHENLSAEQLKAQAPELHNFIKTGVAGDARVRQSAVDASVR